MRDKTIETLAMVGSCIVFVVLVATALYIINILR